MIIHLLRSAVLSAVVGIKAASTKLDNSKYFNPVVQGQTSWQDFELVCSFYFLYCCPFLTSGSYLPSCNIFSVRMK